MSKIVLDASAVLAMALGERGGDRVRQAILTRKAAIYILTVNWCEVFTRLQRDLTLVNGALLDEMLPDVEVVPFSREIAEQAAIYALTAPSLSLGDRACLALANSLGAPAWTADRSWKKFTLGVRVELIRN